MKLAQPRPSRTAQPAAPPASGRGPALRTSPLQLSQARTQREASEYSRKTAETYISRAGKGRPGPDSVPLPMLFALVPVEALGRQGMQMQGLWTVPGILLFDF